MFDRSLAVPLFSVDTGGGSMGAGCHSESVSGGVGVQWGITRLRVTVVVIVP